MHHVPWILRAQGVPEDDGTTPDEKASEQAEPSEGTPDPRRIVAGTVATVNLVDGTCTTTDGLVIRLGPRTAEVADALTLGARVQIDAEGISTAEGLIVTEVWIRPE
ncbi:MAG TPA: hypothetical protein VFG78_04055 [Gemmatimonadota bacterium]|nr:hypothetical protein [Gemmatimonadota bacterium]